MPAESSLCDYCGKRFKRLSTHYIHCALRNTALARWSKRKTRVDPVPEDQKPRKSHMKLWDPFRIKEKTINENAEPNSSWRKDKRPEPCISQENIAGPAGASPTPPPPSDNLDIIILPEPDPVIILPPTRSGRVRRVPRAFMDYVPNVQTRDNWHQTLARLAPPPAAPPEPAVHQPTPEPSPVPEPQPSPQSWYETEPDSFGMFKRYPVKPMRHAKDAEQVEDQLDSRGIQPAQTVRPAYKDPTRCFATSSNS